MLCCIGDVIAERSYGATGGGTTSPSTVKPCYNEREKICMGESPKYSLYPEIVI